jgi:ankyrin repeat protein
MISNHVAPSFTSQSNLLETTTEASSTEFSEKLLTPPWTNLKISLKLQPLFQAVFLGKLEILQKMVADGAKLDGRSNDLSNNTLLHVAALGGDTRTFQWLVEQGLDPLAHNGKNTTPFECAIKASSVEIITYLVKSKIDLYRENQHNCKKIDGGLFIFRESTYIRGMRLCIKQKNGALLQALIAQSPNYKSYLNHALICCAEAGNFTILYEILHHPVNTMYKSCMQRSLLHDEPLFRRCLKGASRNGHLEIVEFLLNQHYITSEAHSKCALWEAVTFDQPEIARYLIRKKGLCLAHHYYDQVESGPNDSTYLQRAVHLGSLGIIKLARDIGINPIHGATEKRAALLGFANHLDYNRVFISSLGEGIYLTRPYTNDFYIKCISPAFSPFHAQKLFEPIITYKKSEMINVLLKWEARLLVGKDEIDQAPVNPENVKFAISQDKPEVLKILLNQKIATPFHLYRAALIQAILPRRLLCLRALLEMDKEPLNTILKGDIGYYLMCNAFSVNGVEPSYKEDIIRLLLSHKISFQKPKETTDTDIVSSYFKSLPPGNLLYHFFLIATANPYITFQRTISIEKDLNSRLVQLLMVYGGRISEEERVSLLQSLDNGSSFKYVPMGKLLPFEEITAAYNAKKEMWKTILDECLYQELIMVRKGQKLLGWGTDLYALTLLHSDGYLSCSSREDPVGRFFTIANELPLDLKAILGNRFIRSSKNYIPGNELPPSLKKYLYTRSVES